MRYGEADYVEPAVIINKDEDDEIQHDEDNKKKKRRKEGQGLVLPPEGAPAVGRRGGRGRGRGRGAGRARGGGRRGGRGRGGRGRRRGGRGRVGGRGRSRNNGRRNIIQPVWRSHHQGSSPRQNDKGLCCFTVSIYSIFSHTVSYSLCGLTCFRLTVFESV